MSNYKFSTIENSKNQRIGQPLFVTSIPCYDLFTLLLHKDPVELTRYHHKKSVSSILMISSKCHHFINPADDIDLKVAP